MTRQQLLALGLSRSMIVDRLRAGRLHGVHLGVYAVGHPALGTDGRLLAAVMACGPQAALSHRSAAGVWGFAASGGRRIDVTVASTAGRQGPPDVHLRRSRTLFREDVTTRGPLWITTPARTLLDLAATLSPQRLESAVRRADEAELFDLTAVAAALARAPHHRGAPRLRRVLDTAAHAGLTLTLSDLEDRFRELCEAHDLPVPAVNARVLGHRRDFTWPSARLVVETDSWTFHRSRRAFEDDRVRDQQLVAAGYRVLRFTHRQVACEPAAVAATILRALAPRGGSGGQCPPDSTRSPR